jgi:hypothetical protein
MSDKTLNLRFLCLIWVVSLLPNNCFAQKTKTEVGKCQIKIEETISEADVKRKCIELARIDAIRNAFGDVIVQGNSTYIQNKNTGEKTETQNVFNFYSDTYVNGEWIEDIAEPKINKTVQNNETWLSVEIKCKVRELQPTVVKFWSKSASCPDVKCQTEQFNDGQDFCLLFKTPVNGYLAVYLDVPMDGKTYRILPYKQYATEGSILVKADNDYIFFSKKHSQLENASYIDEMTLTLTQKGISESNKLFVLFSPKEQFCKPMLANIAETESQKQVIQTNFELPSHLPSEEFQRWLQQVRSRNKEMELSSIYINIKP